MIMRRQTIYILLLSLLMACTGNEFADYEPTIVVEGWIDSGGHPVVMVSKPVMLDGKTKSLESLSENILRDAVVYVSDGTNTVRLRGRYDSKYFPPYIYTTTQLTGEPLKTYRLTVDYENFHAEATTTILPSLKIDTLICVPSDIDTSKYVIHAYFDTEQIKDGYFKFFTATCNEETPDPVFYTTFMGTYNKERVLSEGYAVVHKGTPDMSSAFSPFFSYGDTVTVKLATIDQDSYTFWYNTEQAFNLGRNPLFPTVINVHGNIAGAKGYWCGYGCSIDTIVIK